MNRNRMTIASLAVAAAMVVAACGTATAQSQTTTTTTTTAPMEQEAMADMTHDNHDMGAMSMGDPDATPASEVPGAAVVSGPFEAVAESSATDIGGRAWLARSVAGTTVTIELMNLKPGTDHIAHVHADACAENGGPHYMHDVEGMPHPPNEIHLAFTADADGAGTMTVENPITATDQAVSVVVHEATDEAPKLACADLSPTG